MAVESCFKPFFRRSGLPSFCSTAVVEQKPKWTELVKMNGNAYCFAGCVMLLQPNYFYTSVHMLKNDSSGQTLVLDRVKLAQAPSLVYMRLLKQVDGRRLIFSKTT